MIAASVGNVLVWAVWILAAFACLGSGVAVVSFSNPFYSALALIGNLGSLAVLYLLLSSEFVAAAQVLVYAGAVMVMFLFVIAYVDPRMESPWAGGPGWQAIGAVLAAAALLVEIIVVIGLNAGGSLAHSHDVGASFGSPSYIGRLFLTDHLLAFAAIRGGSRAAVNGPNITWYLGVAGFLFGVGALGVLLRRNPLIVLLSLEIMLNGANLALITFARHLDNGDGQIFALAVMAVAASEVVVGLGLIVAVNRRKLELDVDKLSTLRG